MAPTGIIRYFQEDTVKLARCRLTRPGVIWQLLLMFALLVTPIDTTTTGGGAGQELMDPLKFEITFIASRIYRRQGPPSLSIKDNR